MPFCRQVSPHFRTFPLQSLQGTLPRLCPQASTVCRPS
jgi:hypothetical protein